ncbi:glycine zipper 2TM domain-containing protein [Duganella sp. BJB488]|uniref:glycine zipper 2TM domain-containing protein n=1 Tax=unclassified Duganella TaxID=2636909 RepID=UPI000E3533B2|nr:MULTISPECIES: glycine zipper 2TM domain-containing protein [unclassified Duganella]RFP21841.1 glycine zipper 2TM domain-containing protein [Duganella sp. BJB489]RFP23635.1 glycine zipper 2TM domain-containing protein [Duganella sp. BJB488]RFP38801.1 glycine zipper 2TM domain-containing protein [Duganella sp. BJB480]
METAATSNRIHPLMAAAAVSLTLVSLAGAAAITGLLPNSHGAAVSNPAADMANNASAPLAQQAAPAPTVREVVRYKTIVRHEYPRRQEIAYDSDRVHPAQAEQARDYRPAPAYQQPAPVAQNSPLGIGIGALLGGFVGSHVGGGNGRTLAAIAGAVGGGYVGNEIAKHNQPVGQQ